MPQRSIEQLVAEVARECDTSLPTMLSDQSAAFVGAGDEFYFVGVIGGKDVGKTTLVNVLAGTELARPTGHGEGTRDALAYVHRDIESRVRQSLDKIIPGRYSVVTHAIEHLRLQVLFDLPDIDSVYADHVEITRRMLRHMLFPVWVQSIEKYADHRPRELLRDVAQGNDPANFVFALSKGDLVVKRDGIGAMNELAEDYARRLKLVLNLDQPPKIYVTGQHELLQSQVTQLRQLLSRQREREQVAQSIELAGRRKRATLLEWLGTQNIQARHERSKQVLDDARRVVNDRLLEPLSAQLLTRSRGGSDGRDRVSDAGLSFEVAEEVAREKLWRWPLVNVVDTALLPVTSLVRANVGRSVMTDASALLDQPHRSLAQQVQGAFAELRWLNPASDAGAAGSEMLRTDEAAEKAAGALYDRVERLMTDRRQVLMGRCSPEEGAFGKVIKTPVRWALTFGALAWFPFVQPVAQAILAENGVLSWQQLSLAVNLLGAGPMLQGIVFVAVWVFVLWAVLRYRVHRKVRRELARLNTNSASDEHSLLGQVEVWCDDLVSPWRDHETRLAGLSARVDEAKVDAAKVDVAA